MDISSEMGLMDPSDKRCIFARIPGSHHLKLPLREPLRTISAPPQLEPVPRESSPNPYDGAQPPLEEAPRRASVPVNDVEETFSGIDSLIDELDFLSFCSDREQPFDLKKEPGLRNKDVPRYLFRVYGPQSDGRTTDDEVQTPYVLKHPDGPRQDLFDLPAPKAAEMLNEHLWWIRKKTCDDNLTSWTSSLLTALQYAVYRFQKDRPKMADMKLCVVDTSQFHPDVFLADVDLIGKFRLWRHPVIISPVGNWKMHLSRMWRLRTDGRTYFGEYLSQGRLDLKGRAATVSLDKFFGEDPASGKGEGMELLRLELDKSARAVGSPNKWATAVVEMRGMYNSMAIPERATSGEVRRAREVAEKFGTAWCVPIMIHLLSLKPRRVEDELILEECWNLFESNPEQRMWRPKEWQTLDKLTKDLPEVAQASSIMGDVHDYCVVRMRQSVQNQIKNLAHLVTCTTSFEVLQAVQDKLSSAISSIEGGQAVISGA